MSKINGIELDRKEDFENNPGVIVEFALKNVTTMLGNI